MLRLQIMVFTSVLVLVELVDTTLDTVYFCKSLPLPKERAKKVPVILDNIFKEAKSGQKLLGYPIYCTYSGY